MLKRLISSALVCSMIMSGFTGVEASAYEAESSVPNSYANDVVLAEPKLIELPEGSEYRPDDNIFRISADHIIRPLYLSNGNTYNFYDLLTNSEKTVYDMMKRALSSDPTISRIEMEGVTDLNAVKRACCAFIADNPEYFWLFGMEYWYAYEGDDENNITEIDVGFNYCAGQTADNINSNYNTLMNKVREVVGEANDQYSTNYEKIKYFAKYLSDKVTYNHDAAAAGAPDNPAYANCWNAYGALISGDGVCEAYAEAFKLLCDEAGIPCISVFSDDHEWNAVKLDGKWYYVDVTWIDTENSSTYRYDEWLAVGTATSKKNDNAARSHTPTKNIILSGFNSNFSYPSISTSDYGAASSGSTGTGSGSSGSSSTANEKTKTIKITGSTSYKISATVAPPEVVVSLPASISTILNPYGVAVATESGNYSAEGVVSPVYTIRNQTETNAIAVNAEVYMTVPTDAGSGTPTITVCKNPAEAINNSEKALSAYLLASVSENSVADADSESDDLIRDNDVQYTAGETIVFADATLNSENSNKGTLMTIPKANYEDGKLKDYYYGHFKISGEISDASDAYWGSSDKVSLVIVFNIVPCEDPQ